MKKLLIAAAGLSALTAAPAAAQWGQPQGYGYGYGYNNQQQHGLIRSYIVRADQLRKRVERLDGRDRISEREARRLRQDAAELQQRVRAYANNGLTGSERRDLDIRIARLQQRIQMDRRDGRHAGRGGWIDQNRNGVDDRNEGYYQNDRDFRGGWIDQNHNGVDDRNEGYYRTDRDGRDGWIDQNRNGVDDRNEGYYRTDRDGRDGWIDQNRNGVDDRYERPRW
jgi:hypothetical protein